MSQNPPHRPLPDLAAETTEAIANLVRAGNRPVAAAMAKGISERTFFRWMARGQAAEARAQDGLDVPEDEVRFWQFWRRLKQAERESEVVAVSYLTKAMPSTPTAVLAWLERRFPREWSRTERHELSGPDGTPVQVEDFRARLTERAERIAARLLEAIGLTERAERIAALMPTPTPEERSVAERIALLSAAERERIFAGLTAEEAERLYYDWAYWARPSQLPPPGTWIVWLILSGRGGGKTRTGAETIIHWSEDNDLMALVGRTAADVRDIMVEGESGILRCAPPWNRPEYEPSKRKLTWPNGAVAHCYGADEPALLRGPQHKKGWVDELASFRYDEAFDNFLLGLRLGDHPQVVVTTTPKPRKQLISLMKDPTTHVTRGTTYENLQNLADAFREKVIRRYEGTRLGRQELMAEVLTDVPGALWTLDLIDATRVRDTPPLVEVVVAIDPMARAGNRDDADDDGPGAETGIVVAGQGEDGHGYVLEDATTRGAPGQWATAAIAAYRRHQADRIVGEVNNGGDMVGYTLATIDPRVPFSAVWASRGKYTRAEPVSALYARRWCHHVGIFPELEEQLTTWVPGERSPDRMDALVWALSALFYPTEEEEITLVYDSPVTISPY